MPDKLIRIDFDDIADPAIVANGEDKDFKFIQLDRDSIDICLFYEKPGEYKIIIKRKRNPITLTFTDKKEYEKMARRLEG